MSEDRKNYCDARGMCTAEMFTEVEDCLHFASQKIFPYPGACAMRGMNGTCMSPKANKIPLYPPLAGVAQSAGGGGL